MNDNFIYQFNIDEKICDELINYHKNNTEYKFEGSIVDENGVTVIDKNWKESIDVNYFTCSQNKYIQKYIEQLYIGLQEYCIKYELNDYVLNNQNLIQYYKPNGGFKKWHSERPTAGCVENWIAYRALVYTTYLNDVTDKGETEFKYQSISFKPTKGKTIIFPSDFTHTHRGIPSPTQEKYIATGWFSIK